MPRLHFLSALGLTLTLLSTVALQACSVTALDEPSAPSMSASRLVGVACAHDTQCASGQCGADEAHGTCGVCLEVRKLGERCDGPQQGCSASATCTEGVCTSTRKTLGVLCALQPKGGDALECDDSLYCLGNAGDEQGHCTAFTPVGAACKPWPARCAPDSLCSPAGVCTLVPADSCQLHDCAAGMYCSQSEICQPATLPFGAPCGRIPDTDDYIDAGCAPGAVCTRPPTADPNSWVSDVCLPLPTAGERCFDDSRCAAGFFCDEHPDGALLCAAVRAEGQACTSNRYLNITCTAGLECRGDVCMQPCQ
jgi:hypothetical protein